jgi:hypothetical protein
MHNGGSPQVEGRGVLGSLRIPTAASLVAVGIAARPFGMKPGYEIEYPMAVRPHQLGARQSVPASAPIFAVRAVKGVTKTSD